MLRSFVALQRADPGYDPNSVLTFLPAGPALPAARRSASRSSSRCASGCGAIPGVTAVTAASPLPLDGECIATGALGHRGGRRGSRRSSSRRHLLRAARLLRDAEDAAARRAARSPTPTTSRTRRRSSIDRQARRRRRSRTARGRQAHCSRASAPTRGRDASRSIGVVEHQRHDDRGDGGKACIFVEARWAAASRAAGRCARRAIRERLAAPCAPRSREIDPLMPVPQIQPMTTFVDSAMGADAVRAGADRRLRARSP